MSDTETCQKFNQMVVSEPFERAIESAMAELILNQITSQERLAGIREFLYTLSNIGIKEAEPAQFPLGFGSLNFDPIKRKEN
jgi:hypothetical protein